MYCCQGWENEWSFTNVTGVCDHQIGRFLIKSFEQCTKLLSLNSGQQCGTHGLCHCPRDGYALNDEGQCVPWDQCPGNFY